MSHRRAFLSSLWMAVAWSVMIAATYAQEERQRRETLRAPFPEEVRDSAVISPDGRHLAYVQPSGEQQAVVVDGKTDPAYDRVGALNFSPDGRRWAYAARTGTDWRIVVDGTPQGAYRRVGRPVFNADGSRLVYVALVDEENVAVIEVGKPPGKSYQRILDGDLFFSPDGKRLAYGARKEDKWYAVVDGTEFGPYEFLGASTGIQFSADGKQVAWAALVDLQAETWCVVVDGKKQKTYDNIGQMVFSSQGSRLAYTAMDGDRWRIVAGDQEQEGAYDAVGEGTLLYSPNGKHLACAIQSGGKWLAAIDGKPLRKYDEFAGYDGVAEMKFSPDSRFLAYVVAVGTTEMVVVNTREQKTFDRIGGGTLVFSRDSQRLGYIARAGDDAVAVVGGKRSEPYDMIGYLNFTPDGRHTVFAATKDTHAFTVVDGREASRHFDAIWNPPGRRLIFSTEKAFHYMAIKDNAMYLVEELTE
ncbi:MAG: PD40 domain-containing protein [Planctomycetes bacterium]|nr:PD40 domain-containing protein [Planctomycetota bacterium]